MQKISILGDSILKGVQLDDNSRRYVISDELGFDVIAEKAGLTVRNFSKFGCTITKAWFYVQNMFAKIDADLVFMDFGGNDCDFNWQAIAESPLEIHKPNTDYSEFVTTYGNLVSYMKARRALPVLSTLVPVQSDMYMDYICKTKGLDKAAITKWIANGNCVEHYQQMYSDAIRKVASDNEIPLVDIREAFREERNVKALMCADGIHPNKRGQRVIRDCFASFIDDYIAL